VTLLAAARAARPGTVLREVPGPPDELVLRGGGEVLRLPRTTAAAQRLLLLVRVLPRLRPLLPVVVPLPRLAGVLADGETAFTAERRLPGVPPVGPLGSVAAGQLAGLVAALADVPVREAQMWGVPGPQAPESEVPGPQVPGPEAAGLPVLLHGALRREHLLVDPRRGVLTGVVGWQLRLGARDEDLAGLDPALRDALG